MRINVSSLVALSLTFAVGCSSAGEEGFVAAGSSLDANRATERFSQNSLIFSGQTAGNVVRVLTVTDLKQSDDFFYSLSRSVEGSSSTDWAGQTTGDADNDGVTDLVLRNTKTGEITIQYLEWREGGLSARNFLTAPEVPTERIAPTYHVPPEWRIVALVDFDGDKQKDFLWFNTATGESAVWYMDFRRKGDELLRGEMLFNPNAGGSIRWKLRTAGDLTGDGVPEVIWQSTEDGEVAVWNGLGQGGKPPTSFYTLDGSKKAGIHWVVGAVIDLNQDGRAELGLWNDVSFQVAYWEVSGRNFSGDYLYNTLGWNQPKGSPTQSVLPLIGGVMARK